METREQKLAAQARHMEEVQNRFADQDMKAMSEGMQSNINFEYDVKETLGQEVWDRMSSIFEAAFDGKSDEQIDAVKREARSCLDGCTALQARFDVNYRGINADAAATARRIREDATK